MTVSDIDIRRNIAEIVVKKQVALEQGLIDQATSDRLDERLEEAMRKAEDAGENPFTDWVKYISAMMTSERQKATQFGT